MHKETVQNQIAIEIRKRIAAGMYAPGSMLPRQREFAREFRTSPTTISRILRGIEMRGFLRQKRGVGIRVLPLDDRPRSGAVGILAAVPQPADPQGQRLLRGAQETLTRWQQHVRIAGEFAEPSNASVEAIVNRFSGAIFMQGFGYEHLLEALEMRRFPCVVAKLEKDIKVSCTWVDHGKSTRIAARLLAATGHRRIGLITRPGNLFFYAQVIASYHEAVREFGLCADPSFVVVCKPLNAAGAYEELRVFLAEHRSPSAWIAARDYLAAGACQALTEKGLTIGRDVSVIGFDDATWPQEPPFLTTFAEPDYQLGVVAAEMLVERLISGWRPVERREIEAPLIIRRSTGPCLEPDSFQKMPIAVCRLMIEKNGQGEPALSRDANGLGPWVVKIPPADQK